MTKKLEPTVEEMIRLPIVLLVPGMDTVNVRCGLTYKTAEG